MYEYFDALLFAKGLKAADVCKALGISQSTISNWKKRKNMLSMKYLQKIANYFDVPVDYFINGHYVEEDSDGFIHDVDELSFISTGASRIFHEDFDKEYARIKTLSANEICIEKDKRKREEQETGYVIPSPIDDIIYGFTFQETKDLYTVLELPYARNVIKTIVREFIEYENSKAER